MSLTDDPQMDEILRELHNGLARVQRAVARLIDRIEDEYLPLDRVPPI